MSREYVVTVPVHGYVTYVVEAESASEALAMVNDECAGINEAFEIMWIGKARDAKETQASKAERGVA